MKRSIEDLVETIRNAKDGGTRCSVLIGAGCSVTAGIPTAQGFVEKIKKKYPRAFERALIKTYPMCMGQLAVSEQRRLITEYVDTAKINWAHIALAQLIYAGFVDRVLTTNFDPLVIRACALLGEFPAVYDFAASQNFKPEKIPEKAVFYLHGQHTGFVLLNTVDALEKHSQLLDPVFEDAVRDRVWLVVGYSGENDPVFDQLAKVPCFDNKLYWIGYQDSEPAPHLRQRLLLDGKDAYYINGFDADDFFVTLARELGCFPPDFVSKPFTYLENMLKSLAPYAIPRIGEQINFLEHTQRFVKNAIAVIEPVHTDVLMAWADFLSGNDEKVITLKDKYPIWTPPEVKEIIALTYIKQGDSLVDQAQTEFNEVKKTTESMLITNEETADIIFQQGFEKYIAALKSSPYMYAALNNWGLALYYKAQTQSGELADTFFQQACWKFDAALQIKPDSHEIFANWGAALYLRAIAKSENEADELLRQAIEKYEVALQIKPDAHLVLYNWGIVLQAQAHTKRGENADTLFQKAYEKFAAALTINPDHHKSFFSWGDTLYDQAQTKKGEEVDVLVQQAFDKYESGMKIKVDAYEALTVWGTKLIDQAKIKSGEAAESFFQKAYQKFETALKIRPDDYQVLITWAEALYSQALTKIGDQTDALLKQACDKYEASLRIKPDNHRAINNLGDILFERAKRANGEKATTLLKQAQEKYDEASQIKPDYFFSFNNKGVLLMYLADFVSTEEKEQLLEDAKNLFLQSEAICMGQSAFNLAWIAAIKGQEDDCRKWLQLSKETNNLPEREYLESHPHFGIIREKEWFKKLLDQL